MRMFHERVKRSHVEPPPETPLTRARVASEVGKTLFGSRQQGGGGVDLFLFDLGRQGKKGAEYILRSAGTRLDNFALNTPS